MVRVIRRFGGFAGDNDLVSLRAVLRPLTRILVLTFCICLVLMAALVVQMDARGGLQVQLMMRGAFATRLNALSAMTRDYGRWDDAVVHLYGRLDRRWAVDNLSNATHVLIIDHDGRTLFSVGPDGSAGLDAKEAMPGGVRELLRRLPTSIEGARAMDDALNLVTRFDGDPMLVAAMPIMPYSDRIAAPREPLRYVIITQALDRSLLNTWQQSFRLTRMRLTDTLGAHDPDASAAIRDAEGHVLGYIVWDPVRPGREAALSILPYLLVGFLLLGISCFFLSTRVVGIVRALAKERELASRSADLAAANLDIARQAQVLAEAARLRAEQSALAAEAARREAELCKAGSSWCTRAGQSPRAA